MANTPISGYTTATPSDADVSPFVLSPFGPGFNRKFTFAGLTTYLKTALSGYFSGGGANYISNQWYSLFGNVTVVPGTAASSAGDIAFIPFSVSAPVTIKAVCIRVTTLAAAGNAAIGIYANNPTANKPTGLPLTTVTGLSTAVATVVSANLGATLTLQPGIYWMAVQVDNTTVIFSTTSNLTPSGAIIVGAPSAAVLMNSAGILAPQCQFQTGTYPTMPDQTALTPTPSAGNKGGLVGVQVN